MYGDFDRIPLVQQSFGTLIGSASCEIGGGLSFRIPSVSCFMGRMLSSSVGFEGTGFLTRWMDAVIADSALKRLEI